MMARIATGLHPSHSGVVGNHWFDRTENRDVYCVEGQLVVEKISPKKDFISVHEPSSAAGS